MATRTRHLVVFLSPGTFFREESSLEIARPDTKLAAQKAESIIERYGAKPFGFYFVEQLVHDPIPEGNGGEFTVEAKEVQKSGVYFLGGRLRTLDEIEVDCRDDDRILRGNMRCNGWPIVVENTNSWKSTNPFTENDVLLDQEGNIERRGNAKELQEYRDVTIARVKAELEKEMAEWSKPRKGK